MRVSSVLGFNNNNFRSQNAPAKTFAPTFGGNNGKLLQKAVDVLDLSHNATKPISSAEKLLKKSLGFLDNSSLRRRFPGYEIPINNPALAPYMNDSYSYASLKKLCRQAEADGVFDFKVDEKTGFVKTSDFVPQTYEEKKMANLVWVTDACRNMSLLEKDRPDLCTRSLESLSGFYKSQQKEFDKVIDNPEMFKNHNGWGDGGVFHEFNPENLQPNTDFPRTRLESMGQFLRKSAQYIVGGIEKGKKYGYKNSDEISDNTVDSISNCVKYLSKLNYPNSRSCGAWEEKTFNHSLTSDTAIINNGFRKILNFMYGKTENPEMLKIKERILASKHGDVFNDKNNLDRLLKDGEDRLIANHLEEAPGERELDATLTYVPLYENTRIVPENSALTRSQNVLADVKEHVKLLMKLEGNSQSQGLVGEYGMKRYLGDNYKNLNYDLPDKKGKINENHEAQWFMVSDVAIGYGVQLKKLLKAVKEERRMPNEEEKGIINKLLSKETEYMNRTYARITGKSQNRANGLPCSPNKLSEAYQAITGDYNHVDFVPGTNTPLAQAQSSALDATKIQLQNLKTLEEMGFNS